MEMGKTIQEINIGDHASFTKTISETDVYLFAGISGDFNPMHVNEEYAKKTPFKTRIAHGALPSCLMAPVLGQKLPGLGTVAVQSSTRYLLPVYFGDTITAIGTVVQKDEDKNLVTMEFVWINQNNARIAVGDAIVMPPPEKLREKIKNL